MAVGMGLFIASQVWGFTMLEAFIPGPWAPDALIAFRPDGIAPTDAAAVAQFPGVDPHRCEPLVVEQPRLLEDLTHSAERASVTRQDNVVIVGLHPGRTFGGEQPLLPLEWVAGTPATAIPLIASGRGCLVPDHFLDETGLKVGDEFSLVPPESPDHPVEYMIAGAVRLPGWHWQTKLTGFRPRTHRAAALVFADYETVAHDFSLPKASHAWISYGLGGADPDKLSRAAQALYRDLLQHAVSIGPNPEGGPSIQVMPVEGIRQFTRGAAKRWIWIISQIPIVALLISSFGVLNVMLAAVRARRWEMGVLRSLGFTRSEVVRAVLAEGLLIGITASVLSLSFGILAGWCGCGFSQHISFFGGLYPALVIPWGAVAIGLLAVLVLAVLMAVWPAIDIARTRPLALLQRGRSSF